MTTSSNKMQTLATTRSRVVFYQAVGFFGLIIWCWLDEYFDLPATLFGAAPSPTNTIEAIEESVVIVALGIIITSTTHRLLSKIRQLEGVVPTCSFCKKIRVGETWQPIEEYVSRRSEAQFSHSFCPDCVKQHYGDEKAFNS